MKKIPRMILGCTLAAALSLTACSRSDSGSSGSMSTNMGGSSSQTGQAGQNAAYRTGLGILTEASDQERAGKIDTIAAGCRGQGGRCDAGRGGDLGHGGQHWQGDDAHRRSHQAPEGRRLPAGGGVLAEKGLGRAGGCLWQLSYRQNPG